MTKEKPTKEETEVDEKVTEKKEDIIKEDKKEEKEKPEKKSKKEKKVKKDEEVPDYIKYKQDKDGNFLDVPDFIETSGKKSKYPEFLK